MGNRLQQRADDPHLLQRMALGCVFFCKLKDFRRIATRYEKLDQTTLVVITIASCRVWLR